MEKNSYPGTPEAPFFLQSYGVTLLCKSKKWMNSASVCSFPENQKSKTQVLQGSYLPLYPQVLVFDPDRFCIFPLKAFILLCFFRFGFYHFSRFLFVFFSLIYFLFSFFYIYISMLLLCCSVFFPLSLFLSFFFYHFHQFVFFFYIILQWALWFCRCDEVKDV